MKVTSAVVLLADLGIDLLQLAVDLLAYIANDLELECLKPDPRAALDALADLFAALSGEEVA